MARSTNKPEDTANESLSTAQIHAMPSESMDDSDAQVPDVDGTAADVQPVIQDADNSGGDRFGKTEDPSPALQAQVIATMVAENGTVTEVPSAKMTKAQLSQARGEA